MRVRSRFGAIVALWALSASAAAAQPALYDFVNTIWDHSAVGGPAANVGWQNGRFAGTATNATYGVTATITYEAFGTATRVNGSLGKTAISTGETVLRGNVSNDSNTGATLDNYVVFRLVFNKPVFAGSIRIYDVDEDNNPDDPLSPGWQDFVSVKTYLGAAQLGVTYSPTDPTNQQVTNYLGVTGVMGSNQINKVNTGGDLFINTTTYIDQMEIYFTQGPEGLANSHTIGLYSFTLTPVPEPGSVALGGAALLAAAGLRRLRRGGR